MATFTRRAALQALLGGVATAAAPGGWAGRAPRSKLVVIQFGGGVRGSETIDDPGHEHIPELWRGLVPQGTLFTDMRVEGLVVHPNSTASLLTGHWEYADLDWGRPPAYPTVFELYRRAAGAPDTSAWAFVYASILAKVGESRALGARFAANVVVPPTIPRTVAEEFDGWIAEARATGSPAAEAAAIRRAARLARESSRFALDGLRSPAARDFVQGRIDRWKGDDGSTSHDAFLADTAVACMDRFAPDVLAVCFGEIDCAHYGSWSRYVEAIRRTDALTWQLWQAAQARPAYRDRTLFLILPDHGRELERPGGPGFVHHGDFYANTGADEGCRRVWMLAVGPGVAAGRTVADPWPITAVAATGLEHLGVEPGAGTQKSATSVLRTR
jgi:hypothetical protein